MSSADNLVRFHPRFLSHARGDPGNDHHRWLRFKLSDISLLAWGIAGIIYSAYGMIWPDLA
jgi:hypothetical protein